jgi:hypothetical protein
MARKALTANEALAKIGLNVEQVTKRISRTFGKATAEDILAGKVWYCEAQDLCENLSLFSDYTIDQIAAAMAQLSPRLRWSQNVDSIIALVNDGVVPAYVMSGPAGRAHKAINAAEPFDTFGKAAKKTRSFARNITGDVHAVTVDVWAARIAGVTEDQLKLVGVYEAVAHCYRLAAKRAGIDPQQMQAITWIVIRGSAS